MQDIQAELAKEAREQEMMRVSIERKASSSVSSSTRGGRDISSDRGSRSPRRRPTSPKRGGGGGNGGMGGSSGSDSQGDDGYWEGPPGRGRQGRMEESSAGGRV